jgi:hypothetical protein
MYRNLRTCAYGAVALAALLTLTSCSLLDPEPQPSPVSTKVVDPSMVAPSSEASTPAPTTAAPGASAAPTDGATASPAPSASATSGTSRTTVTPFITSALWDSEGHLLDVEGIVPKIVEDDGTCTLVARKGETVRMVSQPAAPAASTTTCNPLQLPGSQLTAGTWTVTISYVSRHSTGVAATKTVTVTK